MPIIENVLELLLDYEGEPIKKQGEQIGVDPRTGQAEYAESDDAWTFREAVFTALNSSVPDVANRNMPEDVPADKKLLSFEITNKLYKSNVVELSNSEIEWIKERAAKVFVMPLMFGRVVEILEQAPRLALADAPPADPPAADAEESAT